MTISMKGLTKNSELYGDWNPRITVGFGKDTVNVTFASNEPDDGEDWPNVDEEKVSKIFSELTTLLGEHKAFHYACLGFGQAHFSTIDVGTEYDFLPAWRWYDSSRKVYKSDEPYSELGYGWGSSFCAVLENKKTVVKKSTIISVIKKLMTYNGLSYSENFISELSNKLNERKYFSIKLEEATR